MYRARCLYVIYTNSTFNENRTTYTRSGSVAVTTNIKTFTQFKPFIPCGFPYFQKWKDSLSFQSYSSGRHFIHRQTDQKMVCFFFCWNFEKGNNFQAASQMFHVCSNPQLHAVKCRLVASKCVVDLLWRPAVIGNRNNFVYCFESNFDSTRLECVTWTAAPELQDMNLNMYWLMRSSWKIHKYFSGKV